MTIGNPTRVHLRGKCWPIRTREIGGARLKDGLYVTSKNNLFVYTNRDWKSFSQKNPFFFCLDHQSRSTVPLGIFVIANTARSLRFDWRFSVKIDWRFSNILIKKQTSGNRTLWNCSINENPDEHWPFSKTRCFLRSKKLNNNSTKLP